MVKKRIFIDGAAGTTAIELQQRLRQKNFQDLCEVITLPTEIKKDKKHRYLNLNDCDLAVLCLPDDAAKESVSMVQNPKVKILDASSAHRTSYGWVYGLPEYSNEQQRAIQNSVRVSNPGCYPQGAILMLAPLIRYGFLPDKIPLTIWGISGYSGGGNAMIADYQTNPSEKPAKPACVIYGLGQEHKHLPELQDYSLLAYPPVFIPTIGNFYRGMTIVIGLPMRAIGWWQKKMAVSGMADALEPTQRGKTKTDSGDSTKPEAKMQQIWQIWQDTYGNCHQIKLAKAESAVLSQMPSAHAQQLNPELLTGHDDMEFWLFYNQLADRLVLVARYDNLGKGAAGGAMQNIKLMLGI